MSYLTLPDWFSLRRQVIGEPVVDLGEAVARLGSPVTLNRRGQVYWIEQWEFGRKRWETVASAGNDISQIVGGEGFNTSFVMELASDLAEGVITLRRKILVPPGSNVGLAALMRTDGNDYQSRLRLKYHDGAILHQAELILSTANDAVYYLAANRNWIKLADTQDLSAIDIYHYLKIVIDLDTATYISVQYDRSEFDLSGIDIWEVTSTTAYMIEIEIVCEGNATNPPRMWIDSIYATMNEFV